MSLTLRTVVVNGSTTKNDTLTFTELDNNFVYLSQSLAQDYNYLSQSIANGGGGNLQQQLIATATAGALAATPSSPVTFNAGTPLETILRQILIGTATATISSLKLKNGTTEITVPTYTEVNDTISAFNVVSFIATPNSPDQKTPMSASFTASGAGITTIRQYLSDSTTNGTNDINLGSTLYLSPTTPGTVTFTLNAKEPSSFTALGPLTKSTTVAYPIFYGTSSTDYSSAGNLTDLAKLLQSSTGTKSVTIGGPGNYYIYFAYPDSGTSNITSILDATNNQNISNFNKIVRSISSPDGLGWTTDYKIYMARYSGGVYYKTSYDPAGTWQFKIG